MNDIAQLSSRPNIETLATQVFAAFVAVGVLLLVVPTMARAEYVVTSKVEGSFCKGIVFEACEFKTVHAISERKNSQLFSFKKVFAKVDDYNRSNGRCFLDNDRHFSDPKWHAHQRDSSGNWIHLGVPEYFTFNCQQR